MKRVWQSYFLKETAKTFSLVITSLYFLYVLIDYSAHSKLFHQDAIRVSDILGYYLSQFVKRADLFVFFALLIATVKALTTANIRGEIVALVSGGVSFKKLLSPFLFFAACMALFLYLNFQWVQPFALFHLNSFEERYFKESQKDFRVKHLLLEDHSLLVFQSYDPQKQICFDAFWILNPNEIYRIKELSISSQPPCGFCVDHLVRSSSGEMQRKESSAQLLFPKMPIEEKAFFAKANPPRDQALGELFKSLSTHHLLLTTKRMSDRDAQSATFFYYKLLIPLSAFLAVLGPASFCLRFSRNARTFAIYAISLFGAISFFAILQSALILGETQVISPCIAISLVFIFFFFIFGFKYMRLSRC